MLPGWVATLRRSCKLPLQPLQTFSQVPTLPARAPFSRAPGTTGEDRAQPLSFDDGKAFQLKPTSEILRGLFVFRLCSYPQLVNNSMKLMGIARKLMGRRLFVWIMKATTYGQFVAGESTPEIQRSIEKLSRLGIRPMLAVPIEEDIGDQKSQTWYDGNMRTMLSCVDLSLGFSSRSMMQLKITALMSAELCKTLSVALRESSSASELAIHRLVQVMDGQDLAFPLLTDGDAEHFRASLRRLNTIGQHAKQKGVRVLVDAEYTYLNPALTLVSMAMMMRFNQTEPLVWNTYQCYLKDAYSLLSADIEKASSLGFCFGVKLVRGAYMNKERELARTLGYADPVHDNWEATNSSYQKLLDKMLELVGEERERYNLVIASHNETSVRHALHRMTETGISKDHGSVCFAQLLGMCDHISLTLGSAGYSVYKSIPYGSVEEVLPYLSRRAYENQSVLQGLRAERDLLWRELKRRVLRKRANAV